MNHEPSNHLQSCDNRFFHFFHVHCRLEAGDYIAFPIDQEFREIPSDIRFLAIFLIVHGRELVQHCVLHPLAEAFKRFFGSQEREQRIGGLADRESQESRTLHMRRMSDPCRSYNKQCHVHVILGVSAIAQALERVDAIKQLFYVAVVVALNYIHGVIQ